MKKRSNPRFLTISVCGIALCAALFGLSACAGADNSTGADTASGGLPPLTESISVTGTASANEQLGSDTTTATAYTGTDANMIIEQLCSKGCHTKESLLAYAADAATVETEMKAMAEYVKPALTAEQTAALIEFYSGN